MRQIVAGLFVTLDGVAEHPEKWQFPYMDAALGAHLSATMASADALLLGRRTYEEWAEFWPNASPGTPFADYMNDVTKYVVANTVTDLKWHNTQLVPGVLLDGVRAVRDRPGRNILVNGSITLVRSLLSEGLLDELNLMLHPVVVGAGRRLLDDLIPHGLVLTGCRALGSGVVSLTYRPAA